MGDRRSERVKLFVDNFFDLFMQGYSVSEIAEKYGVSTRYGYMLLDEIAEKNNVDKSFFLKNEPCTYVRVNEDYRIVPNKTTYEEIRAKLDEAEELINSVYNTLTSLEKEMLGLIKEMEEGR